MPRPSHRTGPLYRLAHWDVGFPILEVPKVPRADDVLFPGDIQVAIVEYLLVRKNADVAKKERKYKEKQQQMGELETDSIQTLDLDGKHKKLVKQIEVLRGKIPPLKSEVKGLEAKLSQLRQDSDQAKQRKAEGEHTDGRARDAGWGEGDDSGAGDGVGGGEGREGNASGGGTRGGGGYGTGRGDEEKDSTGSAEAARTNMGLVLVRSRHRRGHCSWRRGTNWHGSAGPSPLPSGDNARVYRGDLRRHALPVVGKLCDSSHLPVLLKEVDAYDRLHSLAPVIPRGVALHTPTGHEWDYPLPLTGMRLPRTLSDAD
ncbi:hypothetical protein B0H10DRAFT_2433561 [Mycena sp. CBHHK59/15]|nr:hypothetical protein B0H10DRAFT_2433561 [Mycena sp. CBHHK59/15]